LDTGSGGPVGSSFHNIDVLNIFWHGFLLKAAVSWHLPHGGQCGVMTSDVSLVNKVNQHQVWLVIGWVTIFGRVNHIGM